MKKTLVILILCLAGMLSIQAQDGMYQPKEITGRRINSSGEVIREFPASFSYDSEGKLCSFSFPEWEMNTNHTYEDNKMTLVTTTHTGGGLLYHDQYQFTYEGDLLRTERHFWDSMDGDDECYDYYYDENERLIRKEIIEPYVGCNGYWLYEYDDQQKTTTRVLHALYLDQSQCWSWGELETCFSQFDNEYNLLSTQTDELDPNTGEVTHSVKTLYSYTPSGKLESMTKQTLTDDEWVNTSIEMYLYNENGYLTEQQNGDWSETLSDWNITRKIIHDFDEEALLYTISFYKINEGEWVWDAFGYQKLLFEPQLKWQQKALEQMIWDDLQEPTMMNQIELTMVNTPKPTYMAVDEQESNCALFPNPGNGEVTVVAPSENAVIRFYDLQGRLVKAQLFSFKTNISTDDWTKGIYLWEVWDGAHKEASGKWVKE